MYEKLYKSSLLPSLIFIVVVLLHLASGAPRKCTHLEVESCTEDLRNCHCLPCHTCPKGQGLEPQCGGRSIKYIPQCVPCKHGVTYSSQENVASCEPCPICHGRTVVRPCNATHPTVCSDSCAEGYQFDEVVEDCQLILTTTGSPVVTPGVRSNDKQKPNEPDVQYGGPGKYFVVYLAVAFVVVFVIAVVVLGRLYCCKNNNRRSHSEEQHHMSFFQACLRGFSHVYTSISRGRTDEPPRDVQRPFNTTISEGTLLKEISPDLKRKIATKINKRTGGVKDWKDIAYEYGITSQTAIDEIDQFWHSDTTSPGEELLVKIIIIKPEERLIDFMKVLHKLQRQDVIKMIEREQPLLFSNEDV